MKNDAFKTAFLFFLVALLVSLTTFVIYFNFSVKEQTNESPVYTTPLPVIVLDAGHGGADGGAVAYDGTLEKSLNLEITSVLSELLKVSGYKVVMTRTEDIMLDTGDGAGNAKTRDLKQRLVIASSYPEAITVSLHCNKFPQESCKGLQVYCSEGDTARTIAESVQSNVVKYLQPENHRKVKVADSSIYLLYRAKNPSILIECGFLSNKEECEKLKSHDYQKALALSILCGITESYRND